MTRGWPPKGGNCGAGIESYIRWVSVENGKISKNSVGLYESCRQSRDGWRIVWKGGKLVWTTQGSERIGQGSGGMFAFQWVYDPSHPELGIEETRQPSK